MTKKQLIKLIDNRCNTNKTKEIIRAITLLQAEYMIETESFANSPIDILNETATKKRSKLDNQLRKEIKDYV